MLSSFGVSSMSLGNVLVITLVIFVLLSILIGITCYVIFSFNKSSAPEKLPSVRKRDFTIQELRQFDGTGPDGRILIAVNGNVFDVTSNGKEFYGKDGPYAVFAGRDASRSLTNFTTDIPPCSEEYDDLSDLTSDQMKSLKEWELQFRGNAFDISKATSIYICASLSCILIILLDFTLSLIIYPLNFI